MKKEEKGTIYRYLHNGEVVYVGKTIRPLKQRVKEHCQELKFYGITEIEYYETKMVKDIFKHEAFWINYYKPILNELVPPEEKCLKKMPRNKWKKYKGEVVYCKPIAFDDTIYDETNIDTIAYTLYNFGVEDIKKLY